MSLLNGLKKQVSKFINTMTAKEFIRKNVIYHNQVYQCISYNFTGNQLMLKSNEKIIFVPVNEVKLI